MNGVELPCGSILTVQQADMNYSNKKTRREKKHNISAEVAMQAVPNASGSKSVEVNHTLHEKSRNNGMDGYYDGKEVKLAKVGVKDDPTYEHEMKEENEEDDLDDFFASL